ncbi:MAG: lytic transglycosylase domain-containing protein [Pseudomonadota bacterium]
MPSQVDTVQSQGVNRVTRAIAQSARRTGVDFGYLMNQARIESGMNPNARARTSSATGLYQFIDQSWLDVVEKHGQKHGLGWAADAIHRDGKGRLSVSDSNSKAQIFALRTNPEVAALMAGEFAADNRDYLEGKLGREMAPVDLYLAHFLGPAGAHKFLKQHAANPGAAAAEHFPKAAAANRPIFYADNGKARSFDEIRERFAAKLGNGNALPPGGNIMPAGNKRPVAAARYVQPADYVRIASRRAPDSHNMNTPEAASRSANEHARLAYMRLASMGTDS